MVREASFMSIQVSYNMSNINIEGFEASWKVSKNGKWPVISNCQKWKGFLLKVTSSRKLQMKFCPTWKLKILFSHFQRVQEHEFLMYGWEIMDQSLPSQFEVQKGITFTPQGQMEWDFLQHSCFDMLYPNHALHFINSHHKNIGIFTWISFEFWREFSNLKMKYCFHILTLALAPK